MLSRNTYILRKELREAFSARSTLALWTVSSLLIGYSFNQALGLYSEASRAALEHAELVPGMNPFEGVLVPTLGSLYLITTLLFPFVALRGISSEKQSGTIKLLLQLPSSFSSVLIGKIIGAFLCWTIAMLPALVSLLWWIVCGGHVYPYEVLSLLLGHTLYACAIIGLSYLVAALTSSGSTADLFILAITLGSWILDFSVTSYTESWIKHFQFLSLTQGIRSFEKGLVLSQDLVKFLFVGLTSLLAAWFLLKRPELKDASRIKIHLFLNSAGGILLLLGVIKPFHFDLTEDRRNSFAVQHEERLRHLKENLLIRVALSPDDPRYKDLQRGVLSKLKRIMPRISISMIPTGKSNIFGVGQDESYGLNEYEYRGRVEKSRSTSPREILPILYELSGQAPPEVASNTYPGYPLVLEAPVSGFVFYILFPLIFTLIWWLNFRIPNSQGGKKNDM